MNSKDHQSFYRNSCNSNATRQGWQWPPVDRLRIFTSQSSPEERWGSPVDEDAVEPYRQDSADALAISHGAQTRIDGPRVSSGFPRSLSAAVQTSPLILSNLPRIATCISLGNRRGGFSTQPAIQVPPPVVPSAPMSPTTPTELYVKRGTDFVKVGKLSVKVPPLAMVSQTTFQQTTSTTTAVQPSVEDVSIQHGTPLPGFNNSASQLYSCNFSPVVTMSPQIAANRTRRVTFEERNSMSMEAEQMRVRSMQKQALRERSLDRDDSVVTASFHSARTTMHEPEMTESTATLQDDEYDTCRTHTFSLYPSLTDVSAAGLPYKLKVDVQVLWVFSPDCIVVESPFLINREKFTEVQRLMYGYCFETPYDSTDVPQSRDLVCIWNGADKECHRAVIIDELSRTPTQDWCKVLLLDEVEKPDLEKLRLIPMRDVRPLLQQFLRELQFVICSIRGIRPKAPNDGSSWRDATKYLNKMLVRGPRKYVQLVTYAFNGNCNEVDMFVGEKGKAVSAADVLLSHDLVSKS